jgi:hypothetical protein
MAHFAEINNQNIVQRVIVVANDILLDENGVEQEALGVSFCEQLFGGSWKQTSYNNNIRKNFASPGYSYNSSIDAFVPPKPFDSWVLDTEIAEYVAPVDRPNDGNQYTWNEVNQAWSLIE